MVGRVETIKGLIKHVEIRREIVLPSRMRQTRRHKNIKNKTRKAPKALKTPKSLKSQIWPKGSIVYICGKSIVPFGPNDTDLGGSEQAVVQLSKIWTTKGYTVVVYGNVKESTKDGVEYRSIHKLNLADKFDCAIFWRSYGIRLLPLVQARLRIVDLHDSWDPKQYVAPDQLLELADTIMVKSKYHRSLYDYIPDSKIKIVMNGVQLDLFNSIVSKIPESERSPHRLIYASSYERGLEPILRYTWPRIKKAIPDATFNIYYGMNRLSKTPLGAKLTKLFQQPGVNEHGRVSLEKIAKEKGKSAVHLYISNCRSEIDCISVRESLICGSVPVLGNDYVFKERDGVHVKGSTNDPATYKRAAKTVIDLLKNQDKLQRERSELYKSKTIVSWESVAEEWLNNMR